MEGTSCPCHTVYSMATHSRVLPVSNTGRDWSGHLRSDKGEGIMMIKITEHCSMGCTHCMNAAIPNNVHMEFDMFKKAVDFQNNYGGSMMLLTGGEPTEHPEFERFLEYSIEHALAFITIATNGIWLAGHYDYANHLCKDYKERIMWQVTADPRYYPHPVDLSLPVFKLDSIVCTDKVGPIYPMGRAKDNNIGSFNKASKCFNIRAVTRQVSPACDLGHIVSMMNIKGYFCTPHIAVDGSIKVGESDLCPPCSHIDKPEHEIRQDILKFRCHVCDEANANLPPEYKKLLGD